MKFNFKERLAVFGSFNNRWENVGSGEKRKAIDLPVTIEMRVRELDILVPMATKDSVKFSVFMYGEDARKPMLQTHLFSPMKVHRKPEAIKVSIYDDDTDKRKCMTFTDCSVKDPTITFEEDRAILDFKLQINPTWEQFLRVAENVETKTRRFECIAMKPELFDDPDEEDDDEGEDDAGAQADIEDGDEEGGEDDEEDEEDDED